MRGNNYCVWLLLPVVLPVLRFTSATQQHISNVTCEFTFSNGNKPNFLLPEAGPNSPGDQQLNEDNLIIKSACEWKFVLTKNTVLRVRECVSCRYESCSPALYSVPVYNERLPPSLLTVRVFRACWSPLWLALPQSKKRTSTVRAVSDATVTKDVSLSARPG